MLTGVTQSRGFARVQEQDPACWLSFRSSSPSNKAKHMWVSEDSIPEVASLTCCKVSHSPTLVLHTLPVTNYLGVHQACRLPLRVATAQTKRAGTEYRIKQPRHLKWHTPKKKKKWQLFCKQLNTLNLSPKSPRELGIGTLKNIHSLLPSEVLKGTQLWEDHIFQAPNWNKSAADGQKTD